MSSETPEDAFSALLISMPALPSYPHETLHELRLRRNAPKVASPSDPRTLFLKNVPADATEAHLRAVFAALVGPGRFESAVFPGSSSSASSRSGLFDPASAAILASAPPGGRKRKRVVVRDGEPGLPPVWTRQVLKSGGTALVTLADEKSLQMVLKAVSKARRTKKYPAWGVPVSGGESSSSSTAAAGLGPEWIVSHLRLARADKRATQAAVRAFFEDFNDKEAEAAAAAKRMRSEPDEDGFVTVTRGGRAAPATKGSAEEARRKMAEREEKKREEMKGFYRFQLREARREEQGKLRKRFEEDRRRVESMRERRGKFEPEA